MASNLNVSGLAQLNLLSVDTITSLLGATTLGSTLNVIGSATMNNLTVNTSTSLLGPITFNTMTVNTTTSLLGATSMRSTLNVSGVATLSGGLALSGINKNPLDNYTITEQDTAIYYDDISGTFKTVIFPTPTGNFNGKIVVVTNKTSNKVITLSGTGSINNHRLAMGDTVTVMGISGYGWTPIGIYRTVGNVLNVTWIQLTGSDVSMNNTNWADIISTTYSPLSASSTIIIECYIVYTVLGYGADSFISRINVNGNEIVASQQVYDGNVGGGTRSNTLFPLMGRYTNSSTNNITIAPQFKQWGGDDTVVFKFTSFGNGNNIKITEIAR
jgi:hypothetical protein